MVSESKDTDTLRLLKVVCMKVILYPSMIYNRFRLDYKAQMMFNSK